MKIIKIPTLLFFIMTSLFTQTVLAQSSILVSDAWIADAPPIAKIRAGYMKLHNMSKHAVSINGFNSADFSSVELHKTVVSDNMVKMEEVKQLIIKPGEQIEFKPGSYHLMLFNPRKKLNAGDVVKFNIRLDENMVASFTAEVRKRGDGMQHDHEHHNH